MAVTLIREPGAAVFSRNPVVFEFHTDRRYANEGRPFVGELRFLATQAADAVLKLTQGDATLDFVFRAVPDDSGMELPAWDGSETMEAWRDRVMAALGRNYYVNRDYDLTGLSTDTIRLSAHENGGGYDLSLAEGVGVSLTATQTGVDPLLTPNLKVMAELHVARADGGGFDLYMQAALEPDNDGKATWDVSEALTTALLADGHDRPSLSLPLFEVSGKTVRQFFIRYAEMHGQPQRVRLIADTAVKWGVYGGFSKGMLAERSFPGWFTVAGKLKWLDQSNNYRVVKTDQPDFLYAVNFLSARTDVAVRVKVYFSDNTDVTYTAHTFAAVAAYGRMIIPSGMKQLGAHLQDDEKVVAGYDVWLEDGSGPISEPMRYTMNYRHEPYTRFFVFENSFGAYEGVYVYGRKSRGYDIVQESAQLVQMADFRLEDGERVDFDVRLTDNEEVNTGYMTRRQIRGFRDFFLSTERYAYKNGRYYPITLASGSITEFADGNNLFALSFKVGSRYSEELFTADEETDEYAYTPDLSGYIPPPPLDPENFDDRYYLKTETYNRAEIDAKISAVQSALTALGNAVDIDIAALWVAVNGKAPLHHVHPEYATEGFVYEQLDDTWLFRGDWVQPEPDDEDTEVYGEGNFVMHKGALWKSTVDDNETEPGEPGADWELRLRMPLYTRDASLPTGATGWTAYLLANYGQAQWGDVVYIDGATQVIVCTCYHVDEDPALNKWKRIVEVKE